MDLDSLYIDVFKDNNDSSRYRYHVSLETLIVITIYKSLSPDRLSVNIKLLIEKPDEFSYTINLEGMIYQTLEVEDATDCSTLCTWPVIVKRGVIISGLCAVTRQIIKSSANGDVRKLLGFREACLIACSESSTWTYFCEIAMIDTIKNVIASESISNDSFTIPEAVCRFEYHMKQPIRMHNVYKVAQETNKGKSIDYKVPINELNVAHSYAEGPFMTLIDCILYPCYHILFNYYKNVSFNDSLPLTSVWFDRMRSSGIKLDFTHPGPILSTTKGILKSGYLKQSLYKSDPKRYKPEKRIFTKQCDIERSLKIVNETINKISNGYLPYGHERAFDWSDIPIRANPVGGALPESRSTRKCHQLENLAKAVLKLTETETENHGVSGAGAGAGALRIVDFCSGSGHLGILLACLLPKCRIILVENKEQSLRRASETIEALRLGNVTTVQSNLDYFEGRFEIGVSLHACGTATDLVIQNCVRQKAHFVCCPCCYGGIKDCHLVKYPRSREFAAVEYANYMNLAHAADQTHDVENVKTEQGFNCMDVIDTDRKLFAEDRGYEVFLGKLQPVSCTNKNNLLVGVYNNNKSRLI